jgi:hypothetical protein
VGLKVKVCTGLGTMEKMQLLLEMSHEGRNLGKFASHYTEKRRRRMWNGFELQKQPISQEKKMCISS